MQIKIQSFLDEIWILSAGVVDRACGCYIRSWVCSKRHSSVGVEIMLLLGAVLTCCHCGGDESNRSM